MVSATSKRKSSDQHPWWVKAIHASLVGFLFAVFVAMILVGLYVAGFSFAKDLEQSGIDLGMKLNSDRSSTSMPYEYVFVDVDQEACKRFLDKQSDLDPECLTSKPVPTSLIIDFVRAASESQAAIVIVDVNPPEKNEEQEREALTRELAKNMDSSKTWIIAPIYGRPGESKNGLVVNGDPRFDIVSSHSQGQLRLASVATYAESGIVRVYPTASCLVTNEGQRWVPTIPYLAALLINLPTAAVADQLYFDNQVNTNRYGVIKDENYCGLLQPSENIKNKPNYALEFFDPLAPDQTPSIIQFFFSLPGFSTYADIQERKSVEIKHDPYYQRYEAGKLIDPNCNHQQIDGHSTNPGCFTVRDDLYKNKIIVLGSSRAQAMDQVQTPIGPMSGSELILNATRAFLEFKPLIQPPPLTMLADKFIGIMIAAIPMFIAWGLIFAYWPVTRWMRCCLWLKSRHSSWSILRRCHWGILDLVRPFIVVIIFGTGIGVAYFLEVNHLFHLLKQGVAVDLLFPAIALALEGFAEGAKIVLLTLHGFVENLTRYSKHIFGIFKEKIK